MALLRCADCEEIFDEDEAKVVHDHVGDFWGVPAYQDFLECPFCGSDDIDDYEEDEEGEEEK